MNELLNYGMHPPQVLKRKVLGRGKKAAIMEGGLAPVWGTPSLLQSLDTPATNAHLILPMSGYKATHTHGERGENSP